MRSFVSLQTDNTARCVSTAFNLKIREKIIENINEEERQYSMRSLVTLQTDNTARCASTAFNLKNRVKIRKRDCKALIVSHKKSSANFIRVRITFKTKMYMEYCTKTF